MYSSHHRSSRRRAQGSSRRPQVPRAPPILPDPSLGRLIGVPIHICGNSAGHCVKCRLDQSHGSLLHYPIRGSDGQALYHSQVNVCVARGPRTPGTVPHELHGRIQDFDYTLQLGNHPADPGAWLFDRDRHLAEIGPIENHAAVISKPYGGAMAPALLMRRVNRPGQTYVIEYPRSCGAEHARPRLLGVGTGTSMARSGSGTGTARTTAKRPCASLGRTRATGTGIWTRSSPSSAMRRRRSRR
ncbi:hypothetical protein C8R43DRAFT_229801 [Mycena crocata]|nr:hypothetical protein C8R43DRAFT_229801 [Mycena crocata]